MQLMKKAIGFKDILGIEELTVVKDSVKPVVPIEGSSKKLKNNFEDKIMVKNEI
ncbi:hypothetical protein DPMN_115995 [Dreissena polymorpha]|uniref:Uncharacterized protein n=1 Tax=Dreissena polymorpha TaxID=45954 RepID=A0A9D4KN12_DREPO|nr:hypothetical protein DPMN_115995 [Dreissena polymorpha]